MKNLLKKYSTIFFSILILASSFGILTVPEKVEAQQTIPATGGNGTPLTCPKGYGRMTSNGICINDNIPAQEALRLRTEIEKTNREAKSGCGFFLEGLICEGSRLIASLLLTLTSLVLSLVALVFNGILKYTIVDMGENLNSSSGLGGGIDNAWRTLRDVANIAFIFVLLWAAIQTILELDSGKFKTTLRNIIIVALLINFSLFFTKVVIDASNIAAIGFYNSIFSSSQNSGSTAVPGSKVTLEAGDLSGVFMKALNLQSWYGDKGITKINDPINLLIIGVMGAITMLILSIVLLIASVMFIARFILLIFILILSPVAFIGYIIPGMKGNFDKWKDALINQSFFAPLFFLMMWVAIKLIYSPGFLNTTNQFGEILTDPQSTAKLFLNFILVIGFIVGALILSKNMATKTPGFKAVAGGVGAVAIGGAALAGRKVIGGASTMVSEKYRNKLSQSKAGRSVLWLANKGKNASFDVRGIGETAVGKALGAGNMFSGIGKASGKGGIKAETEKEAKRKAQYAKDVYGQTDEEKSRAEELENDSKEHNKVLKEEKEKVEEEIRDERKKATATAESEKNTAESEVESKRRQYEMAAVTGLGSAGEIEAKKALDDAETKFAEAKKKHIEAIAKEKAKIEDEEYGATVQLLKERAEATRQAMEKAKNIGKERMEAYADRLENNTIGGVIATVAGGVAGGVIGGPIGAGIGALAGGLGSIVQGKASAKAVRKEIKGKSAAEMLREQMEKEEREKKAQEGEATEEEPKEKPAKKEGESP